MNQPVDLKKKKDTMSTIYFSHFKTNKENMGVLFPVKVTVTMLYCTMMDFQGIAMC